MLKKMAAILGILMLVIPVCVNAATFEDGAIKYVLEETKLEHEELENSYYVGVDKDGNYIYEVEIKTGNEQDGYEYEYKFFKATKDTCVEMTAQELLDYIHSTAFNYYNIALEDNELYLLKENGPIIRAFLKATTFDASETYYEYNEGYESYEVVEEPVEANLDKYYIEVFVTLPKSATISGEITYYTFVGQKIEEVENPVSEDILEYLVITSEENSITKTKFKTLDNEVFEDILKDSDVYLCSYNENTKEMFLDIYNYEEGVSYIYDLDGNLMEDVYYIEALSNSLYVAEYNDGTFKVLNKDMKVIYESDEISFYEETYKDYNNYLQLWKNTSSGWIDSFANLYTYKLLSKDNQAYANKAITIEFSGQKDRIKAITVDGKELDKDNYTLSGTLTTVNLKKAYLETLAKGEYKLEVEYIDGVKLTSTFVKKTNPALDNTPATGGIDTSIIGLSVIATVALLGLTGTALKFKKED